MSKKILTAAVAAVMLAGSVAATTSSAQAKPWGWHHHGYGWGGPVALGLGALAVAGAVAASESDCYIARRAMTDEYGNFIGYRRVRVCD